jgi:hypothetical protein
VPRPRGGDWLGDEIQALRRAGIDVLISALTPEESEELNLQCEAEECTNAGISFVSHCIPDRGLPPSNQTFKEMLERVHVALIQGKAVGIHCRAGIGSLISDFCLFAVLFWHDRRTGIPAHYRIQRLSSTGYAGAEAMG